MPRTKTIVARDNRRSCVCTERVTETFTHRQNLDNGRVIRWDGKDLWFCGWSYYGIPPVGWDESKAFPETYSRAFEVEADYS